MSNKLKLPKYERQKFLLLFLKYAGGNLSKLDLQKLLFLYQHEYSLNFFEFVPYLYGCYSFQANSDLEVLEIKGWLYLNKNSVHLNEAPSVSDENNNRIKGFFATHQNLKGSNLLKTVYQSHPYYAINSRISQNLLDADEMKTVLEEKNKYESTTTTLFTIGYEGSTFEGYINQLIRNNVMVLCDVRNNPLSRKFGFSKGMLSTVLPKLGIQYVHIPELGIISAKRQSLEAEADYEMLFNDYKRALPAKQTYINKMIELLHQHKRLALTCFEKNPRFCHRSVLSQFIENTDYVKVVDL
jgi:hypothetical protein